MVMAHFPRYFVTYRRTDSGEILTRPLGRFHDRTMAERAARTHGAMPGHEVLDIRPETQAEAARHAVSRFVTRSLRIVLGTGLTLLSYHYLYRTGPRVGDMPLGKLTLNMMLTLGMHGLLMLAALVFCWDIAFGEGPQNGR